MTSEKSINGWSAALQSLRQSVPARLLLGILLIGAALEAALRILGIMPLGPRIFRERPDYPGYALRPNSSQTYLANGRRVQITLDAAARRRIESAPNDGRMIHLVGGAQAFGWNLSDGETVGARLQDRLGPAWQVLVDAVPGFGPYEMLQQIEEIPFDEDVVFLLSEADGLRGLQSPDPLWTTACGYLVATASLASHLPCWLLASRVIAFVVSRDAELGARMSALPLAYDKVSRSAATVLQFRLKNLIQGQEGLRPEKFLVATVPWISLSGTAASAGSGRLSQLPDDIGLVEQLAARADPSRLFRNNLLTSEGADLVAGILANRLAALYTKRSQP